jgi:hypothetical protein
MWELLKEWLVLKVDPTLMEVYYKNEKTKQ